MTCEKYIKKKNFLLMLGDNFFYGNDLIKLTSDMIKKKNNNEGFKDRLG